MKKWIDIEHWKVEKELYEENMTEYIKNHYIAGCDPYSEEDGESYGVEVNIKLWNKLRERYEK